MARLLRANKKAVLDCHFFGRVVFIPFLLLHIFLHSEVYYVSSLTVAVFGGSGFVGRRISKSLVDAGCDVISISRSGKPPSYYWDNGDMNSDDNGRDNNENSDDIDVSSGNRNWVDDVTWVKFDVDPKMKKNEEKDNNILNLPRIDAAISCIGNVNPDPEWAKQTFFGLAFNETRLFHENGIINENVVRLSQEAGAKRFVYISTSYEVSKMLEGPIPGYINGKRHTEHVAYETFGNADDNAFIIGPSLIYGGKRFAKFGEIYRNLVNSKFANMYTEGNDAIRNLSSAPLEDWVERALFSPPVKVDVVARVATAAALGYIGRDLVGERRQGFYDTQGKPVLYDNLIFIDGTEKIESIDATVINKLRQRQSMNESVQPASNESLEAFKRHHKELEVSKQMTDGSGIEPIFEGALIGKEPFLFPLPVVLFFASIFYLVSTGQYTAV